MTFADGVADDLCVSRRRRCPCIASSSLLDLPTQLHPRDPTYYSDRLLSVTVITVLW